MDKLNHKIPLRNSKSKASLMTILLLLSLSLPLLALPTVAAAPTLALSPTSGPNGTTVKVSGAGWTLTAGIQTAENTPFIVTIDGLTTKAVTYASPLSAGTLNVNRLQVNSTTGLLSGYFIIGGAGALNLGPGTHTVQITDTSGDVAPPVTFTIVAPTVILSPSTGPAGTAVNITAYGFAAPLTVGLTNTVSSFTNSLTAASFAGTGMPVPTIGSVAGFAYTGTSTISGGVLTLTLPTSVSSLPVIVGSGTLQPDSGQTWTGVGTLTGTFTTTIGGYAATGSFVGSGTGGLLSTSALGTRNTAGVTVTITLTSASFATYILTSNRISSGNFSATVSLWPMTTGSLPTFTLTDNQGNTGMAAFALNTPTITLSPASGPVGSLVTVTAAGFGPYGLGTGITSVRFGAQTVGVGAPTVNEQGTSTFVFTVPAGTVDSTTGAHTVTVNDIFVNTATASFSITPKAIITLGSATVNTGTTYAPTGATAQLYVTASGLRPSSTVTLIGSSGVPAAWLVLSATATDANGAITATSTTTAAAPATGTYSVTLSDGSNSVAVILTILSSGNIITATPTTGAAGTTVTVTYYGAAAPANILFDSSTVIPAPAGAAQTWPTVVANFATFIVPASGAGTHIISATGFNSIFCTVVAPAITIVSPASASVGTTVTVVGSGYSAASGTPLVAIDGVTVPATGSVASTGTLLATFTVSNFLAGAHTLSVSDLVGGVPYNTASTSFNVIGASITVNPASSILSTATSSKTIGINGAGFKANEGLIVMFDTTVITATTPAGLGIVNPSGQIIFNSGFVIPIAAVAGTHTITVTGITSGASAPATFTIIPRVALTPATLRAPATSLVSGAGFAPSSAMTIAMNGTSVFWFNTATTANTTTITTDGSGNIPATAAVVIAPSAADGLYMFVVADAGGNSAAVNMTVLATPTITLGATGVVAGATGVSISGRGFSPLDPSAGRAVSAQLISGNTVISIVTLSAATVTPSSSGSWSTSIITGLPVLTFTVPQVAEGSYIIQLTLAASGTIPAESANATLTVLGAPVATVAPVSIGSGGNVSISVVGLAGLIEIATIGGVSLVVTHVPVVIATVPQFGSVTIPATGTNAFKLTTWFLAPTNLPAGNYSLTLIDSGARSATVAVVVTPAIALSATSGIKGSAVTITGTGFAASSTFSVSVNGAVVMPAATGTTTSAGANGGALPGGVIIAVPVTATATNTVTVTDAAGNTVSATFNVTAPTLIITPASGTVGATVQLLGSGYATGSAIIVQVAGTIVTTAPATVTATTGSFIAYITVPSGLSGNVTITAIDSSNNVGTATLTVTSGGTVTFTVNQAALSSTAQTVDSATGAAKTSFARGTSVKFTFVLASTAGSGSTVWRITLQQPDLSVYNIVSTTASVTTNPSTLSYTQLLPTGVQAGAWKATIQIFAPDGVTPLAVTTVTFTAT